MHDAGRRPARLDAGGRCSRRGSGSVTSSHEPSRTLADRAATAPSTQDLAGIDQVGGGGARQAEQPRQRDIEAQPGQPSGSGSDRVGLTSPTPFAVARRDPSNSMPSRATMAAVTAPQTIAESARLNTGQMWPSLLNRLIQSTTCPRPKPGRPEQPVDQVAERAAEDQPQRDRPADRAHPPGRADDHDDDDERDGGQQHGGAGSDRECGAGVAGLDQVDRAAEQPDLRRAGRVRRRRASC